jgi:hypothetical protein
LKEGKKEGRKEGKKERRKEGAAHQVHFLNDDLESKYFF